MDVIIDEKPNDWDEKRQREKVAIATAINQCTSDLNSAVYHLKEVVPLNGNQNWETINEHNNVQYICPFKYVGKIIPKTEEENIEEYNKLLFNVCFANAEKDLRKKLSFIIDDIQRLEINIRDLRAIRTFIDEGIAQANSTLPLREEQLLSKVGHHVHHNDYPTLENLQQAAVTNSFDIEQAEGLKLRLEQEKTLLKWRIQQLDIRRKVWIFRDRLLGVWQEIKADGNTFPSDYVGVGSYPLFQGNEVPIVYNLTTPNRRSPAY
jgi:hypothetical protein